MGKISSDVTYWFLFWCGCQPLIPRNVEAKKRIPPSCFSPLPFISHSVHGWAVPAAPGAAGPHAETAAGAERTAAATSQNCSYNYQHTGQCRQTTIPFLYLFIVVDAGSCPVLRRQRDKKEEVVLPQKCNILSRIAGMILNTKWHI